MPRTRPHAVAALAPTSSQAPPDRRQHHRIPLERAGKLHHVATGRFLPIDTLDVSQGGALIRIEPLDPHDRLCPNVGDRVCLGVAWDGETILDDDAMRTAVVVRLNGRSSPQATLALRFTRESALPAHVAAAA